MVSGEAGRVGGIPCLDHALPGPDTNWPGSPSGPLDSDVRVLANIYPVPWDKFIDVET